MQFFFPWNSRVHFCFKRWSGVPGEKSHVWSFDVICKSVFVGFLVNFFEVISSDWPTMDPDMLPIPRDEYITLQFWTSKSCIRITHYAKPFLWKTAFYSLSKWREAIINFSILVQSGPTKLSESISGPVNELHSLPKNVRRCWEHRSLYKHIIDFLKITDW